MSLETTDPPSFFTAVVAVSRGCKDRVRGSLDGFAVMVSHLDQYVKRVWRWIYNLFTICLFGAWIRAEWIQNGMNQSGIVYSVNF